MNEEKIVIDLPNGDKLVAEKCPCDNGYQIAVGICSNDIWIQDLTVVETTEDNKYEVYVFGNEYDESYTENFSIDRISSDAL